MSALHSSDRTVFSNKAGGLSSRLITCGCRSSSCTSALVGVVSSNLTTSTKNNDSLAVLWSLTEWASGVEQGPEWRRHERLQRQRPTASPALSNRQQQLVQIPCWTQPNLWRPWRVVRVADHRRALLERVSPACPTTHPVPVCSGRRCGRTSAGPGRKGEQPGRGTQAHRW